MNVPLDDINGLNTHGNYQQPIMTTGSAGGMAKPYKGMLPASAGTRPEYD